MATILWQSRSPVIFNSFERGELQNAANGGNAYDYQAAKALQKKFQVSIDKHSIKRPGELLPLYWWRMQQQRSGADVVIMEPFPLLFGKLSNKTKSVAMIHHIDEHAVKNSLSHQWFFRQLKKRLPETDLVITVSTYWKDYLSGIGCSNVKVIYNSFDLQQYQIAAERIATFKNRHGFTNGLPILYIGNASRQKGVYETYNALKNSPYQLVMSGSENNAGDLPVKFLSLDRENYITLLHAADAVITMSKLIEGWNRVAHEALLCKTPVIGSGTGGMRELLEGAGQMIVRNPVDLPAAVAKVLENRMEAGQSGYDYCSKFNTAYFEEEWNSAIENLLKQ
ncbi:MAG: glycosyltransferase family 4 protein [Bacteroidota bacterium]|nr:glycosyltransferase family 4 protein [Bacteroidota bacterium]